MILENEDYKNRKTIESNFVKMGTEIAAFAKEPREKICVSIGVAA